MDLAAVSIPLSAPFAWVHLPANPSFATVLQFLTSRYSHVPEQLWHQRVSSGHVTFENGEVITPDTPYRNHCRVRYLKTLPQEPRIPFAEEVVYEDEHIVIAYKPHFLPVVPGAEYVQESLVYRLRQRLQLPDLSPAHRLDRDTAGLVLLCKQIPERGHYQRLFQQRKVTKRYLAVAHAVQEPPLEERYTWAHHLDAAHDPAPWFAMAVYEQEQDREPNALTQAWHVGATKTHAFLCLEPFTGRKHQLRVQAAHAGFPLINDRFYPRMLPKQTDDYAEPLQLLAYGLAFCDPLTHQEHRFTSPHLLKYWPNDVLRLPPLLR